MNKTFTRTTALLATAALAFGLTACTGTTDPSPTPSGSASTEPQLDEVLTLEDEVGAREELTDFTCSATDDTWSASGTVTNPTDANAVYVVNIGIIEKDSRSSALRKNVVLEVAGGESKSFEEANLISDIDDGEHECIARVNRGSAVAEG